MSYSSLRSCLTDLEKQGMLVRVEEEVDPFLEMAEIHKLIFKAGGPALWFQHVKGSPFTAASNIFGTKERIEFIFRSSLYKIEQLLKLKADPGLFLKQAFRSMALLPFITKAIPRRSILTKSVMDHSTQIHQLPQIVCWPKDGGAFITLPQVISFPPFQSYLAKANIGMYRIQLSGNQYTPDKEVGIHYQLHRGIGIHHQLYNQTQSDFRISVGIGGPPAYTLASIFPLPEGLSEILFSGLLGNRSYKYCWHNRYFIPTSADFCITGKVKPGVLKNEGPFGDHLGYYSLEHPFPVLEVENVFHKKNAIFPFTVVGQPPQEDSWFGYLIHKMVAPLTENEFPGIKEIHAVDVAGVHPLLLAIGSERYMPFREKMPEEILTQANLLLGKGQTSLAKYVIITADEENVPETKSVREFLNHVLQRLDWEKDLHFYTHTTMDTLDYSGTGWNAGSKLVMACNRLPFRKLSKQFEIKSRLPKGFDQCFLLQEGLLILEAPAFSTHTFASEEIQRLCIALKENDMHGIALIVLTDQFYSMQNSYTHFLWATFTKSNPSHDIYGVDSYTANKHWACKGPLIIDARTKSHHAPELTSNPEIVLRARKKIEAHPTLKKYLQ